jgi:hypothetical protein
VESGSDATKAVAMIVIKPGRRCGFYAEELEDLAESIREQATDCGIEIEWYRDDSGVKYRLGPLEIQTIAASVPWEALTGAAATIFLEAVRDWMSRRYQARKSRYDTDVAEAAEARREASKFRLFKRRQPSWVRQFEPTPVVPHQVSIYGPKGELLGVVYQDARLNQPAILIGEAAIEHAKAQGQGAPWY